MASNKQQYEADGDVVMQSAHQPYEETIRQRCFESKERPETAMKPVKSSIHRTLLEVICLYELRKAVDDVSNEEILILIKQRIGTVKNEQLPDLDELFRKKLKINLAEDDIDARVLKYYRDFATIIENNGLEKILGVGNPDAQRFADRMKMRCSILIDNLEPRMVLRPRRTISCSSTSSKRMRGLSINITCWQWNRRRILLPVVNPVRLIQKPSPGRRSNEFMGIRASTRSLILHHSLNRWGRLHRKQGVGTVKAHTGFEIARLQRLKIRVEQWTR
eukprot:jgi/Phyca11/127711/e_gw1.71.72.1